MVLPSIDFLRLLIFGPKANSPQPCSSHYGLGLGPSKGAEKEKQKENTT